MADSQVKTATEKAADVKAGTGKSTEVKTETEKSTDVKTGAEKVTEVKTATVKSADVKTGAEKATEVKIATVKSADVKTVTEKTADLKGGTEKLTEVKTGTEKSADENSEKKDKKPGAEVKEKVEDSEEAKKAEELWDKKLKEVQMSIQRFAPHKVPDLEQQPLKEHCLWHLRIYPIDQEDCRNCILEAAARISRKTLYYVPRRRNGHGTAEMFIVSDKDAVSIMGRVIRTPFHHRYVTVELTRTSQGGVKDRSKLPEETATLVLDTTKCERIRNTVVAKDAQKNLWVRYLPDNTSPEILRVLFPLSTNAQVQVHDGLRFGLVEANSKADLQVFMKAYLTVIINNTSVWSLYTKEPGEKESAVKAEIEKVMQALGDHKPAPIESTDKYSQRREDKNETARILKRTLHQQQGMDQPPNKRSRVDQPTQRGVAGNWNWGGGVNQFAAGAVGGHSGFGAQLNPRGITEMVMMQARLNQLMMLNPGARRGFNTGFGGGRFGGAGIRGGNKGFGRGW